MAVAFDAVGPSASGTAGPNPLTWTHTASGTNRAVIVGVSYTDGSYANNEVATYGGVSMTRLAGVNSNNDFHGYAVLFVLVNPPTGSQTVSVSSVNNVIGGSISFTGVDQSTPFDTPNTAYGDNSSGSNPPTVVVSSSVGDMVVDVVVNGSGLDGAQGTLRWLDNVDNNGAAGNAAQSTYPGAASVTAKYIPTSGLDWWGMIAVNVKAAVGTPSPIGIPGYAAF